MLKYKLKSPCVNPESETPLVDYLHLLGINKVNSFLGEPPQEDELSPTLLDSIDVCVEKLYDGFTHHKKFFIVVDCDVDGYTSAAIFYQFFKQQYPDAIID